MDTQKVVTVVGDGVSVMELGVLSEIFGIDRVKSGGVPFRHVVVSEPWGSVATDHGFSIEVVHGYGHAEDADILCVLTEQSTEPIGQIIRRAESRGTWIIGIGRGVFGLASTGVLDGRRATAHWMCADELSALYPAVNVEDDTLFAEDRRIITCAGKAAAVDASLHVIRQEHGAASANVIARDLVTPAKRCSSQSQFVAKPLPDDLDITLAPLIAWMLENLDRDLSLSVLADQAHMSQRTFSRKFKEEVGVSPAMWLTRQRLTRAQQLLETTSLPVEVIADDVGFASSAVLRQNFTKSLGTSPTAYRETFACPEISARARAADLGARCPDAGCFT